MRTEIDRQTIRIPSDSAHVATIRSFVGAIGRHAGCSDETIEDLRLVATEACAQVLEQDAASDGIEVRTWSEDGQLVMEIEPCGAFERADAVDGSFASATRRTLIDALFPGALFERRESGAVLRVSAPAASS